MRSTSLSLGWNVDEVREVAVRHPRDPARELRVERIFFSPSAMPPAGSGPSGSARAEADMSEQYVDGNVLGGPLGEVFAVDVTAAVSRCASCGRTEPVATLLEGPAVERG